MAVESEEMGSKTSPVSSDCGSKGDMTCELENHTKENFESSPKVRKPYTITKQREKWTEEEHQKFLEALKLYGRGWRQIEEHVGTKTAIQIRSHAQKFFSKVVRGSDDGCAKPVDIPPPRPKRKPVHPYPRKLADSLTVTLVSKQPERSPSPNSLDADKGRKSPTSVISYQHNRSPSATSCTTDVLSMSLSPEKGSDYVTLNSSEEEKKPPRSNVENLSLRTEACDKETLPTIEKAPKLSASSSFKLFGRTVVVCDSQKDRLDTNLSLARPSFVDRTSQAKLFTGSKQMPRNSSDDKERSCTDSNESSTTGNARETHGDRNLEVVDSFSRPRNVEPCSSRRGFVPYKRCLAERDNSSSSSMIASGDRERQKIRVC